jgi:hypothetical protein
VRRQSSVRAAHADFVAVPADTIPMHRSSKSIGAIAAARAKAQAEMVNPEKSTT